MDKIDHDDPKAVVTTFIAAMHEWEVQSWKAMRAARETNDPSSYQAQVLESMKAVFDKFCTKRSRPHGRQGSFGKPPQYDPDQEQITTVQVISKNKAHVDTNRFAMFAGGRYRYVLYRRQGKWLIDNVKHEYDDKWEQDIL